MSDLEITSKTSPRVPLACGRQKAATAAISFGHGRSARSGDGSRLRSCELQSSELQAAGCCIASATARPSPAQPSPAQRSTAQPSRQPSTTQQHSTAQRSAAHLGEAHGAGLVAGGGVGAQANHHLHGLQGRLRGEQYVPFPFPSAGMDSTTASAIATTDTIQPDTASRMVYPPWCPCPPP